MKCFHVRMILGLTLILHKSKQNIDNAEIVLNNLQDTFVMWLGLVQRVVGASAMCGRGRGEVGRCLSHKGRTNGATYCRGAVDALFGLSDKGGTRRVTHALLSSAVRESCC